MSSQDEKVKSKKRQDMCSKNRTESRAKEWLGAEWLGMESTNQEGAVIRRKNDSIHK